LLSKILPAPFLDEVCLASKKRFITIQVSGIFVKRYLLSCCLLFIALFAPAQEAYEVATLRPGDVLQVNVFRVDELNITVRVEEDGCFSFPHCGLIEAAGRSTRDIAKQISECISSQVSNPHVDVFVSSWAPRTVYILGEVNNSGMSLELPNYSQMTALQAISAAGGFSESADLTNVAVLRRNQASKTLTRMPIDVSALASQKSGGDEFVLEPEDTLIVPKAPPVYVSGLVGSPGVYYIDTQRPPLCSELLVRAGSLALGADAEQIQILRANAAGSRETISVSLTEIIDSNYQNDVKIQPGDYVVVRNAEQIFVLGQVNTPGPLTLPLNLKVTVSRAIFMAGGFTGIAKEKEVLLIRGLEIIRLNLAKMYKSPKKLADDLELQKGDIIFVQESFW